MTPRLVLTALLLVAAPAARALPQVPPAPSAGDPVAAAPACIYFYSAMPKMTGDMPVRLPPSKRECDFLISLEEPFAKLAAAAELKGKTVLANWVVIEPSLNAFAQAGGAVFVNDQFVKKLLDNRPAAIWILAHEIGHVVQEKEGELAKRNAVLSNAVLTETEKNDFSRAYESKADRIAGDLLKLAGYPLDFATRVDEALGGPNFSLSSAHTHPAVGIRWLEALKQQESLALERETEAKRTVRHRAHVLLASPPWKIDPDVREASDNRSPVEWAESDPDAARYRARPEYKPAVKLEQFDQQGRLPTSRSWKVSGNEPPLSIVPASLRSDPGVKNLSVRDQLAVRARSLGPQSNYNEAVWTGAWDWLTSGDWWPGKTKEPAKTAKP